jgi:CO/xanthine dehydrogenase Mo-binding subunit
MTGFIQERKGEQSLHAKAYSRRTFLKGGGALLVGFSVVGPLSDGTARAAAANTPNVPPDATQVDSWLAILSDGSISLYPPKMEFGQGTYTGFRQIVAEELYVPVESIHIPLWDTGSAHPFPDNPVSQTVGSNGTANGGPAVRQAAAAAYQALLRMASSSLGVPTGNLTVTNGVVSGGAKTVTYASLVGNQLFATKITNLEPVKDPSRYTIVGTRVPRFDIPDIVTGAKTYIQNVRVPGMLHGRVVRPRGQANIFGQTPQGTPANFTLLSVDADSVKHLPNVQIVQKNNFLGVVAPVEYDAIQAAAQIKAVWAEVNSLPGSGSLYQAIRAAPTRDAQELNYGSVDTAFASAAKVLTATYEFPFQMHGPIGPTAAIADISSTGGTVFVQGQDGWGSQTAAAQATGLTASSIRTIYYEGASVFNTSPNLPVIADAAIMSQAVGKPVRVQYMRWDSHGWEMYGQANVADVKGGLDSNGKLIAYDYISWLTPNNSPNPGPIQTGTIVQPADATTGSSVRGAPDLGAVTSSNPPSGGARIETFSTGDQYFPNIPNRRVTGKTYPSIFYTCPLRAPDCIQPAWGSESMIDELAHAANTDAYQFRLAMTTHPGWLGVLNAVATASNWQTRVSASNLSDDPIVTGRGIAIAGENHASADVYAGVVAEVQVNKKTGKILVTHLYGAQDSGVIVNPASVENQMIGMLVRGAGRTTIEQVAFSKQRVTALDWATYPMLRFKDSPAVTPIVIGHPTETATAATSPQALAGPRYRGAGESLEAVVPAAIGNAVFDATGVRMRQIPLTPAKVQAALKAAKIS